MNQEKLRARSLLLPYVKRSEGRNYTLLEGYGECTHDLIRF